MRAIKKCSRAPKTEILAMTLIAGTLLAGCGSDAASTPGSSSSTTNSAAGSGSSAGIPDSTPATSPASAPLSTSAPSSAPTSAPSSAPTAPPTDAKAPASGSTAKTDGDPLPKSLHHDGYEYAGVTYTKPMDMELTISDQKAIRTGSQSITFKGVKDGKAVYSVDRTGQLATLGTEEWTVTDKGVFTTKSSMMDIGKDAMELPANPKPGMKWKVHTKSDQPTAKMDMDMTFKVIGIEGVSTKAGKFPQALLIEQDGQGTLQGQKVRTESKNWYVKGIGLVKATMMNHVEGGKTESLTIQETNVK